MKKGTNRLIILVLFSFMLAALLFVWVSGILDFGNDGEGDVLLEHDWRAIGTAGEPEFHEVSLPFEVGSGVENVRISYNVDLPSDLAIGLPSGNPSPEVTLELLDDGGTIVWSDVSYSSASSTEGVEVTVAGSWTLHVSMKGYGYDGETGIGTPIEFHDSVKVTVSGI